MLMADTQKVFRTGISAILFFSVLVLTGCDSTNDSEPEMGKLVVQLTDAPDDYESVMIDVREVRINNTDDSTGWETVAEPNRRYNLLDLTNGAYEVLGDTTLSAGMYPQIRLVLGSNNTVTVDGETHELKVPSGAQSGLKLNVNADIQDDITYTLLLDFDVSRSIHLRGNQQNNNGYIMRPVIRAMNRAVTGTVSGVIDPAETNAVVYAMAGSDTLTSTFADTTDGIFKIIGLDEGTIDVHASPRNNAYKDTTVTEVDITVGENTSLDTLHVSKTDSAQGGLL